MDNKTPLQIQQQAAAKASERMLMMLLGYDPAQKLTVNDVKFIAEWTRTCAFDAIAEATGAL